VTKPLIVAYRSIESLYTLLQGKKPQIQEIQAKHQKQRKGNRGTQVENSTLAWRSTNTAVGVSPETFLLLQI
jgi:hypothetical protein